MSEGDCIDCLWFLQDSSDFSSYQLDRLMKQSQLSQRLESVRQEMSYSAGGVEDLIDNSEDTTVESSRLASDDLAHYVLIKGKEATDDMASAIDEAAEDVSVEDEELKREQKSSQCRMSEQFVIRKIERDRHAGRKFAPVCEVNLSSSSSSDEDDSIVTTSASVSTAHSHTAVDKLTMTATVAEVEDKQKLSAPEDVIETKRWKSDDTSTDSIVEDESNEVLKSPFVLNQDNEDQKSPTTLIVGETPISDSQLMTVAFDNNTADDQCHDPAIDKHDGQSSEVASRNKDVSVETREVVDKEPQNGQ